MYPADPVLEANDQERMKHEVFLFAADDLLCIGTALGESLVKRLDQRILALPVQVWHVHFVIGATAAAISDVVKCAKDAVPYALRPGRPIWTDGYDKRFCFDEAAARARIAYVERHNLERGWLARPWDFVVPFDI